MDLKAILADPKKLTSGITVVVLGAVWLVMTAKHQTPPSALTQAIVAAAGSFAASGVLAGAKPEDKKDAT